MSEKLYDVNTVITLKLKGAEEVIGRFVSSTDGAISISKPLQIYPAGDGQIGTMPYVLTAVDSEPFAFPLEYVVLHRQTNRYISDMYISRTTELDLSAAAPKSIITG
jgi:hypothetical protein